MSGISRWVDCPFEGIVSGESGRSRQMAWKDRWIDGISMREMTGQAGKRQAVAWNGGAYASQAARMVDDARARERDSPRSVHCSMNAARRRKRFDTGHNVTGQDNTLPTSRER